MSTATSNTTERRAMLRRVAIVLQSLPEPVARKLLGSIGPQMKADVTRMLRTLEDVDPLERRRAMEAFRSSVGAASPSSLMTGSKNTDSQRTGSGNPQGSPDRFSAGGDEFIRSSSAGDARASGSPGHMQLGGGTGDPTYSTLYADSSGGVPQADGEGGEMVDGSPLQFLADLPDSTLVALLNVESPSTIATVFASLAPTHAARLLPQLSSHLQRPVVLRLGRLGEIPAFAAKELADHFRDSIARHSSPPSSPSSTSAVLEAILAVLPDADASNPSPQWATDSHQAAPEPATLPQPHASRSEMPHAQTTRAQITRAEITRAETARAETARPETSHSETSRPATQRPNSSSRNQTPSPSSKPDPNSESLDRAIQNLSDTLPDRFDDPLDPDVRLRAAVAPIRNTDAPSHRAPRATPPAEASTPPAAAHAADAKPPRDTNQGRTTIPIRPSTSDSESSATTVSLSTAEVEERLLRLTPEQLCASLARVNTRQAVLTLCGLSPVTADATLALLPKATANTVRHQMLSLQTMNLREIDDAKSAVASASLQLESESVSGSTSMAAAA